jgi:hypothetical protein
VLLPAAAIAQSQTAPPATREEEMKAARDRAKSVTDALAQVSVPIATEPALQFKA